MGFVTPQEHQNLQEQEKDSRKNNQDGGSSQANPAIGKVGNYPPLSNSWPASGSAENETTDMALFVRTSSETLSDWNRQRIVDALMRETTIDRDTAERISREVEERSPSSRLP